MGSSWRPWRNHVQRKVAEVAEGGFQLMKKFAVLTAAAAGIFCTSATAVAHTALGKEYEANFYAWMSCHENHMGLENTLSCTFPMQGIDHVDAITVYCKETKFLPTWDKKWMQEYGKTDFARLPESAWRIVLPFTVQYFSYHVKNKKGFVFALRGPYSPWANECRRVFPDLEN